MHALLRQALGLRSIVGSVGVLAAVIAIALAPGASAGNSSGALNCPLPKYNPTHYALQTGQSVTCTIDGAGDASGKSTVPVIIKSSAFGNTPVTGTVSGSGASTKVTFTYTAPANGCDTSVVAYIKEGNNANNSKLTPGGHSAAGFAFVASSGKVRACGAATTRIYLGYADTYRTPDGVPSPWRGSPNVIFVGCGVNPNGAVPAANTCLTNGNGDIYDSGAIRIDNTSGSPMSVTAASVSVPPVCNFNPWPGLNVTIPAGWTLILTSTDSTDPCGAVATGTNFDVSDTWDILGMPSCANNGLIPQITITINGVTSTINDTGQILNWGGIDPGDCGVADIELRNWVQIQ